MSALMIARILVQILEYILDILNREIAVHLIINGLQFTFFYLRLEIFEVLETVAFR